jgi:hypothetical protein
MYQDFYDSIEDVETQVLYDLDLFFETFSPIPDYTMAFNLIMDSLGLLVPAAMAPIFNSRLFPLLSPVLPHRSLNSSRAQSYEVLHSTPGSTGYC